MENTSNNSGHIPNNVPDVPNNSDMDSLVYLSYERNRLLVELQHQIRCDSIIADRMRDYWKQLGYND